MEEKKETKTIREWLQELPEPYNLLALSELEGDTGVPQAMEISLHGALCGGFKWHRTGYYDFWSRVHSHFLGLGYLPPIPEGYAKGIVWPKESDAEQAEAKADSPAAIRKKLVMYGNHAITVTATVYPSCVDFHAECTVEGVSLFNTSYNQSIHVAFWTLIADVHDAIDRMGKTDYHGDLDGLGFEKGDVE